MTASPQPDRTEAIAVRDLFKTFDGTVALRGMTLSVRRGRPHGLVGQNGCGKSTLIKILAGSLQADAGTLTIWGREFDSHVHEGARHGIAVIHQDLALVESMSALENFSVGARFGSGSLLGPIRWRAERRRFAAVAEQFEVNIRPREVVRDLNASQRACLAIMRAIRQLDEMADSEGRLLVLDEPTVYLNHDEKIRLSALMKRLVSNGVDVLLVSHELGYVLDTCEEVTVARDGNVVGTVTSETANETRLVEMMLGRTGDVITEPVVSTARVDESIEIGITGGGSEHVLRLAAGEVLGLTGIAGAGHEQLPYAIAEAAFRGSREVRLQSRVGQGRLPLSGCDLGIVPADRSMRGIWAEGSVAENLQISSLNSGRKLRLVSPGKLSASAEKMIDEYGVVAAADQKMSRLSGGNQQKVVMARALSGTVRLLVLHEPTQGVDVGAAAEIISRIRTAAAGGTAVLVSSSDTRLLTWLCDRVAVFSAGSPVVELGRDDLSEQRLAAECHASRGPVRARFAEVGS